MITDQKSTTDTIVPGSEQEEGDFSRYPGWRQKSNRKLNFDYRRWR
jgi:hypothetical protein